MAERSTDANDANRLYGWWLDAIPAFFPAFAPAPTAGPDGAADASAASPDDASPPYPIGPLLNALAATQQWMQPLYAALFQALALPHAGGAFDAFEQVLQGRMGNLTDRLSAINQASSRQGGLGALGAGWMAAPLAALADSMKPLALNLERAYGGLADAFGLASSRELQQALRDMATAALAHRQAQAEYLGMVASALGQGSDALMSQLAEMGARGEAVDSVKSLLRLWARSSDDAMHRAMQSPAALEASARLLRTATRSRQQQQRVVAIASEALNVPTRAEVDEAYREIQALKRELRRLRKAAEAPPAAAPESARKATPRKATTARKSKAR